MRDEHFSRDDLELTIRNETPWRSRDIWKVICLIEQALPSIREFSWAEPTRLQPQCHRLTIRHATIGTQYDYVCMPTNERGQRYDGSTYVIVNTTIWLPKRRLDPYGLEQLLRVSVFGKHAEDAMSDNVRRRVAHMRRMFDTFGTLDRTVTFRQKRKRKHHAKRA